MPSTTSNTTPSSVLSSEDPDERLTKSTRRRRWVRIGLGIAGGATGVTAILGLMHLPFAAPLLRAVFPSACPVTRGTPQQIDRAHALGAALIRNSAAAPAPSRPALGFELDRTRRSDLDTWAAQHAIACKSITGNETLQRCTSVAPAAVGQPSALGSLEEVTFEFRSSGELVNVQTLRRNLTAEQAAGAVAELERRASAALGAPSSRGGEPTVAHLSRGLLATFVATHTFKDYRATVSATNLAPTGIMVREEYLSAR